MITVELLDKIQTPIDLIGLSMGGTIAQQIVKMRPKMVNNLMLVSTFARLRPSVKKTLPYLSKRFKQMVLGDIRDQANTVADRIFPDENQMEFHEYLIEQIKHANPRVYRQSMIAMAAFNGTPWMRNWQGRTLVVAGSEDSTVTLENQRRLARIIQNGRFEIIPGAGHALTIDHVDQFNLLMIDFLKNSEK
jgi:pimeloyl-ACP methyl ester carboxylesterase